MFRDDTARTLAEIEATLDDQVLPLVPEAVGGNLDGLVIEFVVPQRLLDTPFERWMFDRHRFARPIGLRYPVLVCSRERIEDPATHDPWAARTRRLAEYGRQAGDASTYFVLRDARQEPAPADEATTVYTHLVGELRASPAHGPDDGLTLQLAFSAGQDLRLTGEYAAARVLDEDTLDRCRRVYGPGHRRTLTAENNVAVCLRLLGEPAEAYRHDVDVWAGRSALHGEHDVLAQGSAVNPAWDLHGLGRYGEMSQQAAQTLEAPAQRLPPTHVVSLLARRAQVVALHAGGLWPQAAAFSEEVYADHVQHPGPESERTLQMGLTRVNALRCVGRLTAARDLAVETQETYRRTFGWRHPGSSAASIALAAVLRAGRQSDDARRAWVTWS